MFCDLPVHVDGTAAGRRRVSLAVDLAKRADARLSGLHVTPSPEVPPRYKPSRVAEVAATISGYLAADAQAAAAFGEETKKCRVETSWHEAAGDVVEGICKRARYADLVILGQYECQGAAEAHPLPVAHSVVLGCGRPVLVVPADIGASSFARAAIAWDGSRAAVRAVHDALSVMRLLHSVEIVEIIDGAAHDDLDAERLSAHLSRHGIHTKPEILRSGTANEHETLREQLGHGHYDLVIMGAYSHSMWREFIFGGATQLVLLSSQVPVLVSH
jgi:nucleotide-binding universal stress UspA family protein